MQRNIFQRIQIFFIEIMAKVHWHTNRVLTPEQRAELNERLAKDYYVIATARMGALSTFFIRLGAFFMTGKWGKYTHVLMNLEDEVSTEDDFRFVEATGPGVHYSSFDDVFPPTYEIALLKPKNVTLAEWTAAMDRAKTYLGRPYDNLFNLKSDLEINCVELVWLAIQGIPDYKTKFPAFEKLVEKKDKLVPDMFANCPDFEVVYQLKR